MQHNLIEGRRISVGDLHMIDALNNECFRFIIGAYKTDIIPKHTKHSPIYYRKLFMSNNMLELLKIDNGSIPMLCPSEKELLNLLESSLQLEKRLFPHWSMSNGVESSHKVGFNVYVLNEKICVWDVVNILKDTKVNVHITSLVKKF